MRELLIELGTSDEFFFMKLWSETTESTNSQYMVKSKGKYVIFAYNFHNHFFYIDKGCEFWLFDLELLIPLVKKMTNLNITHIEAF